MKKVIGSFWASSSNAAKSEVLFWGFCAFLRGFVYALPYCSIQAPLNAVGLFLGYAAPLLLAPFLCKAISGKLPLELLRGQIRNFPTYFNMVYGRKLYFHLSLVALIAVACATGLTFFYLYADQWGEQWMADQRNYFHQYNQNWLNNEGNKMALADADLQFIFLKLQKLRLAAIRTASFHLDVLQFFQGTYYAILVLGILTTLLSGLVLANLVKIGWDNSSSNLKTTFLYLAGTSVFFNLLPQLLNHEEIIKNHSQAYQNCIYMENTLESYALELHYTVKPKLKQYSDRIARCDTSTEQNVLNMEAATKPEEVEKYKTRIATCDSLSFVYTGKLDSLQKRITLRFDSLDRELYRNSSISFKFVPSVIDNLGEELTQILQNDQTAPAP